MKGKFRERHWGKSDAPYRKYLPSDLNVERDNGARVMHHTGIIFQVT
jgi:hypothetical protein